MSTKNQKTGSAGGKERAKRLSSRRRSDIARHAARTRWLKPKKILEDEKEIGVLCREFGIKRLYAFGSILRDDFGPKSDVDLLYETGTRNLRFKDECRLEEKLHHIFDRKIDLVSMTVVTSSNRFLKASILNGARLIYED